MGSNTPTRGYLRAPTTSARADGDLRTPQATKSPNSVLGPKRPITRGRHVFPLARPHRTPHRLWPTHTLDVLTPKDLATWVRTHPPSTPQQVDKGPTTLPRVAPKPPSTHPQITEKQPTYLRCKVHFEKRFCCRYLTILPHLSLTEVVYFSR